MISYEPRSPPVAATIAGSDSGGGAGIQADLKTMAAHGVFGTSIVTAVTAQNTRGVEGSYPLDTEQVRAQYKAVVDDFDVGAIKTGMLATAPIVETVTASVRSFEGPVVVDPVMIAATGDRLLSEAAEDAYGELIAESTLVTPNADEATALTGMHIRTAADAAAAGRALVDRGADAALVKGGHIDGETVVDTLVRRKRDAVAVDRFEHERVDTDATHGSGCTLSSAIAARLARGAALDSAVELSVEFMGRAVRYGVDVGGGPGAVNPLVDSRE
ncbi:bifunctional hydroxymethylpyrimidine kinase/phosphomethylpyrimidine kinase [Halalkalirubrum salinum]|uniref:bifunctional hydroxymethylpyrimidine kinase/phosphomethylpyrimidine kinase n=1 Tax=Halalkalirubrum salinum TaxID=2563889 RepID=UPI0010FB106C|nr:bifunctional hydroxymethylpyrimidine kinase/phosphomethylpyrimidine kinase [Halalkalirubrum salinum]